MCLICRTAEFYTRLCFVLSFYSFILRNWPSGDWIVLIWYSTQHIYIAVYLLLRLKIPGVWMRIAGKLLIRRRFHGLKSWGPSKSIRGRFWKICNCDYTPGDLWRITKHHYNLMDLQLMITRGLWIMISRGLWSRSLSLLMDVPILSETPVMVTHAWKQSYGIFIKQWGHTQKLRGIVDARFKQIWRIVMCNLCV